MASTGGGFLIDDLSTLAAPPSTSLEAPVPASTIVPRPLTAKQEARLRAYLDGELLALSRGYRKRFDPSAPLPSLPPFVEQWRRILGVLAQIPPYGGGSTNLLVSYLLRCTSDICEGIAGYSLAMEIEKARRERKRKRADTQGESGRASGLSDFDDGGGKGGGGDDNGEDDSKDLEDEEQRRREELATHNRQLHLVLEALDLLDRMWSALLRGHMINLPVAQQHARRAFSDASDMPDPAQRGSGKAPFQSRYDAAQGSRRPTSAFVPSPTVDGRFPATSLDAIPASDRESLPIQGGKGPRTVGQTDRVRLRNITVLAREKLFAWMRQELDAPLPPTMDEGEDDDGTATAGDMMSCATAQQMLKEEEDEEEQREVEAAEELEGDMEDVPIDSAQADAPPAMVEEAYDPREDTAEHRHFQELFDRKIDPDDSDSEGDGGSAQAEAKADTGSRSSASPGPARTKRRHSASPPAAETRRKAARRTQRTFAPQSETASVEVDVHGDSMVQWDLAFTRLFSKTLRQLSDLADESRGIGQGSAPVGGGVEGVGGAEGADEGEEEGA
ncbi:hypothetical protein ACQY0O_000383 [Thecaphora frezii]